MKTEHQDAEIKPATDPDVLRELVASHRVFLRFLEKRVESPAVAEEILQAAFVKAMEKGAQIREGERAVAWFYRLLRHALIDHYRHRSVEKRAQDSMRSELSEAHDAELEDTICQCVKGLIKTLKPEYARILSEVDLEDKSLATVAAEGGLTVNNATVRLHRARQALKRQLQQSCGTCADHGCLNCACDRAPHVDTRS